MCHDELTIASGAVCGDEVSDFHPVPEHSILTGPIRGPQIDSCHDVSNHVVHRCEADTYRMPLGILFGILGRCCARVDEKFSRTAHARAVADAKGINNAARMKSLHKEAA